MTYEARSVLEESEVIVGYTLYVNMIKDIIGEKEYLDTGMTREVERCHMALASADAGHTTALVCSGDSGVYGMAGICLELAVGYHDVEVEVIPGVTAALSGGAVLGAPLGHDFAVISLSDRLTSWDTIEKRLVGASVADFVICLYNPSSRGRKDYLKKACQIILRYKDEKTVCGYVRNIGRQGEERKVVTLGELSDTEVDMFTTVFVGNTMTKNIAGRMVTPRGYKK